MIPEFPAFQTLSISHKKDVEMIVGKYPPYSDFNFVSMFTWNTRERIELSRLNGNLIVKFEDYITDEVFYSFIGTHAVTRTINTLLNHLKDKGLPEQLKLIPEETVKNVRNKRNYIITEDTDGFDYILSVPEVALLDKRKHYGKLKHTRKFLKTTPKHTVVLLNLDDKKVHAQIMRVFELWRKGKSKSRENSQNELIAIQRLLGHAKDLNLVTLGLYHGKVLIAFGVAEESHSGYSIFHYLKAHPDYSGIFSFMYHKVAQHLHLKGYDFINIEQDLGLEGLRKAKKQWRPVHYLKKYTVSRR